MSMVSTGWRAIRVCMFFGTWVEAEGVDPGIPGVV
jgi:hypothetical protein